MDKSKYIEFATMYYAVAIRGYYENVAYDSVATLSSFKQAYSFQDESGSPELETFIGNDVLLDNAIEWMLDHDLIGIVGDEFAPPLYLQTARADGKWEELEKAQNNPYYRYRLTPHKERQSWLSAALSKVNSEYHRLGMTADDFKKPDSEWEPLPLDRSDERLTTAIKAIDETIEAVRSDNGYSATQPQEKTYVLEGLSALSKTLKQAETVSLGYIKTYGLEPLSRLINRFGPAAVGATAALARDSVYSWLKAAGIKGLELLWKMLFS